MCSTLQVKTQAAPGEAVKNALANTETWKMKCNSHCLF